MKMRPGTQTVFSCAARNGLTEKRLKCARPGTRGWWAESRGTRADARQALNHAVASLRRTRALPRWKRREILETWLPLSLNKGALRAVDRSRGGKPVRMARTEVDRAVLTFKTAAKKLYGWRREHSSGLDRRQ